jgi:excisionase family DNA binding protein
MNKLAYKVEEAAEKANICRAKLFQAIREGTLIARKHGRSTLILHEDLENFLRDMPMRQTAATPKTGEAA